MDSPLDIGRRIRSAREDAGLSQEQLGNRLDPPRSHAAVSDMERGVTNVGAGVLAQLANILDRPPGYFYGVQTSTRDAASAFQARGRPGGSREDRAGLEDFKKHVEQLAKKTKKTE
ncbi:MAG: helix-turn-helix transcriptional regulator [Chloroflexi bacterium]|nr:helix-turn-helix transcriptional regulator [Chloroflexota bacterium]